jgi:hypothetical protein
MCYLFWEPDDTQSGAFEFNDGASFPTPGVEGIGLLHNKSGGNIVRLDGGVEFITQQNFTVEASKPTINRLWWSPFTAAGVQPGH